MRRVLASLVGVLLLVASAAAQAPTITTPKQFLGYDIGDDYFLANFQQLKGYWEKLATQSDRIKLVTIGTTEEGRPQIAAIVTSPENHKILDGLKDISRRLARAEGVTENQARELAARGKAVVWIDGGLHASEVLCAQVLIETVYRFLAANDAETKRILDDVVILFVHANPDGHDLVADWYMKEKDPAKRTSTGLPRLYQKYIGHDNNRDFYANTQAETKNMNRFMYREWCPQIMYNHHQTGPAGTVLFCPPFRDPFNYFCDPLVLNGIDSVGAAMMQRFLVEGKLGATVRSGAPYSTWFNGGLRTTASFHNIIGILTETIGSPTPTQIPLVTDKQLPKGDYLAPIPPQRWRFRQSVEYSVTANMAVLDYASRHREQLLFNVWRMGQNAIEKGSRDSWTITPKIVEAAKKEKGNRGAGGVEFDRLFRKPELRDARGYILPADQPDFPTAVKFVNALLGTGVRVHRAKESFTINGRNYPAGSLVVKSVQAYRAHVLDMFEPQDHPNDFAYPGGPPIKPYDSAGYTLAYQMGVKFDRVLTHFDGPFEEIPDEQLAPPPAKVANADGAAGYLLDHRLNDVFRAVNRLHKAKVEVRQVQKAAMLDGAAVPPGTFFIPKSAAADALVPKLAAELGVPFVGTKTAPDAVPTKPARVALWDRHGGSMPSGWTRWLLERFEFPFEVVMAPEFEQGNLRAKYDVLLLVDGAYSARGGDPKQEGEKEEKMPTAKESSRPGPITAKALPHLKAFLDAGGTILSIGSATRLGRDLGVPVANHLADLDDPAKERTGGATKYYIPSSVLRVAVDPSSPLAWGMEDKADVMFSMSPTFRLTGGIEPVGIKKVAWFDSKAPLRSGWAWGQDYLEGGVAIVDAKVGAGRLALFGPQVLFRGQSHGTFKLVFNGIVQSTLNPPPPAAPRPTAPSPKPLLP
ncbi:MAG: peptidase [Gemmataceae bacterium]|nr:peptidase [Gemmataceae bacterium]